MRFTLEMQRTSLQDRIDHAEIDHPEFTPEELKKFKEDKANMIFCLDRIIAKSKEAVQLIIT